MPNLRQACKSDLPKLKVMYDDINKNLKEKDACIYWSEFYPFPTFEQDIKQGNLFVFVEDDNIISAFSLAEKASGEECFEWKSPLQASYLSKFAVDVKYSRKGFGLQALKFAEQIARKRKSKFLRLMVVDVNTPAIELYKRFGFSKVLGVYNENIYEDIFISELGFEKEI